MLNYDKIIHPKTGETLNTNSKYAKKIILQIVETIDYIHSNFIIIKDIKLDNVLLKTNQFESDIDDLSSHEKQISLAEKKLSRMQKGNSNIPLETMYADDNKKLEEELKLEVMRNKILSGILVLVILVLVVFK